MTNLESQFESIVRRVVNEENRSLLATVERALGEIRDQLTRINPPDATAEREVFTLEDISDFSGIKPETLRKNYVSKGIINATKNRGRFIVSRDEYLRLKKWFDKYHTLLGA